MSNHTENENGKFDELRAQTLLALVGEHKRNCDGKCGLSLFLLFPVYRKIKGEAAMRDVEHFI